MTADPQTQRRSPLHGALHGDPARVHLAEIPFLVATDLRVPPESPTAAALGAALGVTLPPNVGHSAHQAPFTVLALGPDWWLVLGEGALERLERAHVAAFASIVDVSAQRTCIAVHGPRVRALLEHGWEQDLDPTEFSVGRCSQGLIARAPVVLHHAGPERYHLHVRASFARHLWTFLVDAAVELLE